MNEDLLSALQKRFPAHSGALPALVPALDAGEPAPFLLRYRRDLLNGLDEVAFFKVRAGHREERELVKRRGATRRALEEIGASADLLRRVDQTRDLALLEDLIRPVREARRASGRRPEDPMAPVARQLLAGVEEVPAPPTEAQPTEAQATDAQSTDEVETPEAPTADAVVEGADTAAPAEPTAEPTADTAADTADAAAAPDGDDAAAGDVVVAAEPIAEPIEDAPAVEAAPAAQAESAESAEVADSPDAASTPEAASPEAETPEAEVPEAEVPEAASPQAAPSDELVAETLLWRLLAPFCGKDGAHPTVVDQTERLLHLMADVIGADALSRQAVRTVARKKGRLTSTVTTGREVKTQYLPVTSLDEPLNRMKPRTLLLMRRAQKSGAIHVRVVLPDEDVQALLDGPLGVPAGHPHPDLVRAAAMDALERILLPAASIELVNERKRVAERAMLPKFADTLRDRLMAPPAGNVPVVAVAPGATGTARILMVDADGRPGRTAAVHPLPPRNEIEPAAQALREMVAEAGARIVAVPGSGRASALRDWVGKTLAESPELNASCVPVHEGAAASFADSEAGKADAPELPSSARAALSMARYVQSPVAEIVRYDVTNLALGPNQRDVDQGELRRLLDDVVEECVALVGADINKATPELLSRMPGFDAGVAQAIVARRETEGPFATLADLRTLEAVSEEAWQRAGGFLRVVGGDEPLDATTVHPTGYDIARAAAERLARPVTELIGDGGALRSLDLAELAGEAHTEADVESVLRALARGVSDPRGQFVPPASNPGVRRLRDVEEGMDLEGVIVSVAPFGAFVDVGAHQQGLVHVSELNHEFVEDPLQVVSVGDRVAVRVLGVDPAKRRLSLSMKARMAAPPRPDFDDRPGTAPGGGRRGPGGPGGPGGRRDGDRRGGQRRGGPGGGRDRGGPPRRGSPVPAVREIPRENDPFHMQLSELRAKLGLASEAPKKKKQAVRPKGRREKSRKAHAAAAAAEASDEAVVPATPPVDAAPVPEVAVDVTEVRVPVDAEPGTPEPPQTEPPQTEPPQTEPAESVDEPVTDVAAEPAAPEASSAPASEKPPAEPDGAA